MNYFLFFFSLCFFSMSDKSMKISKKKKERKNGGLVRSCILPFLYYAVIVIMFLLLIFLFLIQMIRYLVHFLLPSSIWSCVCVRLAFKKLILCEYQCVLLFFNLEKLYWWTIGKKNTSESLALIIIGEEKKQMLNVCVIITDVYVRYMWIKQMNDYFYDFLSFFLFSSYYMFFWKCINEIDCYYLKIKLLFESFYFTKIKRIYFMTNNKIFFLLKIVLFSFCCCYEWFILYYYVMTKQLISSSYFYLL
jgi:hypothetical protein